MPNCPDCGYRVTPALLGNEAWLYCEQCEQWLGVWMILLNDGPMWYWFSFKTSNHQTTVVISLFMPDRPRDQGPVLLTGTANHHQRLGRELAISNAFSKGEGSGLFSREQCHNLWRAYFDSLRAGLKRSPENGQTTDSI
jgi:hypothetical protein